MYCRQLRDVNLKTMVVEDGHIHVAPFRAGSDIANALEYMWRELKEKK